VGVDIPDKFKPYQYHKREIKDTLQGSINAKRNKTEMEDKIEKVLFIPSYIKASEYDGESKILDLNALVEPGPNQSYIINGVKIIKNKKTGNNYEMDDNINLGDNSKIKNIKVNIELFLILKTKKIEGESRRKELWRKIHDMIMNNGTCDNAMAKLRKGLDKAADITPSPGEEDLAEADAQTREAINSGVGKLKKTDNRNKIENRESRRLSEDKRLALKGRKNPPARPKRHPNKDYRHTKTRPKIRHRELQSARSKLRSVDSRGNPYTGGKRTRKKRRRKKKTRRK
jgi:hypothetical protein